MKTIDEIKAELAKECGEDHFDVLLHSELSVRDYETARRLLTTVVNRFIDQYVEEDKN